MLSFARSHFICHCNTSSGSDSKKN